MSSLGGNNVHSIQGSMMAHLRSILEQMRDTGVLEDRREYTREDLQKMYVLSDADSNDLYSFVQEQFESGLPDLDKIPAEVVKEYLEESIHGDWEGFQEKHKDALDLMITDLRRYAKHRN